MDITEHSAQCRPWHAHRTCSMNGVCYCRATGPSPSTAALCSVTAIHQRQRPNMVAPWSSGPATGSRAVSLTSFLEATVTPAFPKLGSEEEILMFPILSTTALYAAYGDSRMGPCPRNSMCRSAVSTVPRCVSALIS